MMVNSTPRGKKVGVLTANGGLLKNGPTLLYSGLSDAQIARVEVEGLESDEGFNAVLGLSGALDPNVVQRAVLDGIERLMKREPNLGSILLECTELAPSAREVQECPNCPSGISRHLLTGCIAARFAGTSRATSSDWLNQSNPLSSCRNLSLIHI